MTLEVSESGEAEAFSVHHFSTANVGHWTGHSEVRNQVDDSFCCLCLYFTGSRRRTAMVAPISIVIASSPNSTAPS